MRSIFRKLSLCAAVGAAGLLGVSSRASAVTMEVGAATMNATNLGGGEWQYAISLSNDSATNTSDTTIGTFWFAWAPGQEYMTAVPTDVQSATGWTEKLTGAGNSTDGTAIQWVAGSSSLLDAGQTIAGFQFESTETPTEITGPNPFFQNQPQTQSAAYTAAPFSDTTTAGDVFDVALGTVDSTPPGGGSTGSVGGGGGGTSAVPLPAAAGQAIAGFMVIGIFALGKRVVRRFSVV
jgi:hypothetical protein